MFTGIIEEVGVVERVGPLAGGIRFSIRAPGSSLELKVDDSVSINGACHTVVRLEGELFEVESVEETLRKTTMGGLRAGSAVNLELPMKLNDRLGGHLVLGHVDSVGHVTKVEPRESSNLYSVRVDRKFERYLVPVGSVAVDGVSLTIAGIHEGGFDVSVIPHTLSHTTFRLYEPGSALNIEFDLIGKYIERMMLASEGTKTVKPFFTKEQLGQMGY